jgi:hypothetical protein
VKDSPVHRLGEGSGHETDGVGETVRLAGVVSQRPEGQFAQLGRCLGFEEVGASVDGMNRLAVGTFAGIGVTHSLGCGLQAAGPGRERFWIELHHVLLTEP